MRVGLVGCVKSKQEVAAPAGDLYTSPLFLGRRAAVEASCDRWFILSAQHGLLDPAEVLEPYDLTLSSLPVAERRRWSTNVVAALRDELGDLSQHAFEVHAGAAYTGHGSGRRATTRPCCREAAARRAVARTATRSLRRSEARSSSVPTRHAGPRRVVWSLAEPT
jgi:hypothetical protein